MYERFESFLDKIVWFIWGWADGGREAGFSSSAASLRKCVLQNWKPQLRAVLSNQKVQMKPGLVYTILKGIEV